MPRRPHPHPAFLVLVLFALFPVMGRAASAPRRIIPVSAAGAELMRQVWEAGGLRNNPQARAVVERMQADEAGGLSEPPTEPGATRRRTAPAPARAT